MSAINITQPPEIKALHAEEAALDAYVEKLALEIEEALD